ncbi:MAG: Uma2 family endonuclease [Luteolibacter sp.]
MTAALKRSHLSVEEYLNGEIDSPVKHEYLGGEVHAMAGATNRHNLIASNTLGLLFGDLRGKSCRAFNSNTKVRIELQNQTRLYYPDAMVVCDSNSGTDVYQERPVIIIEVLSDSTRRTDLTEKREAYMAIPSLKVLLFVETDEPAVLVYRRGPMGGFLPEKYEGLEAVIALPEIGAQLSVAEIYERVDF